MKKIFYIYTLILVFLILFKFRFTIDDITSAIEHFRNNNYQRSNLIFFNTIKMQINILDRWAITNLLANTIPFVVYGLLFSLAFKYSILKSIIINLLFIIIIELVQFIFIIGTFDIDDIFLNISSIIIGTLFVRFVYRNDEYYKKL